MGLTRVPRITRNEDDYSIGIDAEVPTDPVSLNERPKSVILRIPSRSQPLLWTALRVVFVYVG